MGRLVVYSSLQEAFPSCMNDASQYCAGTPTKVYCYEDCLRDIPSVSQFSSVALEKLDNAAKLPETTNVFCCSAIAFGSTPRMRSYYRLWKGYAKSTDVSWLDPVVDFEMRGSGSDGGTYFAGMGEVKSGNALSMLNALQAEEKYAFACLGVEGGIESLTHHEAFFQHFLKLKDKVLMYRIEDYIALFCIALDIMQGIAFVTSDGEGRALWIALK